MLDHCCQSLSVELLNFKRVTLVLRHIYQESNFSPSVGINRQPLLGLMHASDEGKSNVGETARELFQLS